MKVKKKQILCLVLTLFVFFSGMCFEQIEADSLFVFTSLKEPLSYAGVCDTAVSDNTLCTLEMLGHGNLTYVGSYANKNAYGRKDLEKSLEFLYVDAGSCSLSGFYETVDAVSFKKLCHCLFVLNYIHNTDGKKRN